MAFVQSELTNALQTLNAIGVEYNQMYLDGLKKGNRCENELEISRYLFNLVDTYKFFDLDIADADKCITDDQVSLILNYGLSFATKPCNEYWIFS